MLLNQDYEEGTNGTTITIANSAGTGEDAVDTAVTATGNTQKYDTTTHLTSGSVSLKHTVVSTSNGNCYWAWITTLGTQTQYYIRGYFKFDTATTVTLFMGLNGSTTSWSIQVGSTGHIILRSGATSQGVGTFTIATNTVFRVEAFIDHTNGAITCKLFSGGNSEGATPDETISYTGQTMGGVANDTALRVGPQNVTNVIVWSDAVKMSTTSYIGAQNPPAADVFSGGLVSATSTVSGKVNAKHRIGGTISATTSIGGSIIKPGTPTVVSTYGAGIYGTAIYGGSAGTVVTGLTGHIFATSTISGAVNRTGLSGGIYTPPYTPPTPPPGTPPGTFGPFAQAVYDDLNGDLLTV